MLRQIKNGQNMQTAMLSLYHKSFPSVKRWICYNNGRVEDAEDIFQEAILILIDLIKRNDYKYKASITTILYAISRNRWLQQLKKNERFTAVENFEELVNQKVIIPRVEDEIDESLQLPVINKQEAIENIFDHLPEGCKQVLMDYYFHQLRYEEAVIESPFSSAQALKNKKSKCLKRLKSLVDENPAFKRHIRRQLEAQSETI
ncbi:hypothetical protein PEPS_06430 [Persicobacter psychrovividus]|uniref:RNA polymerase sigma-70 region 2 domain-containing protein n=2 Tax=Persicobacter psychrovividus TaxID=387638 RepID=A0ABM7VBR2_9BACT|nr:hypothetical protein PEPS_06430 [Persicobacter psychrovividus]